MTGFGQSHPTCLARSRFTTTVRELTENVKTAQAVISLHRKQMADALIHEGKEDL